jgi:hypothetical protein
MPSNSAWLTPEPFELQTISTACFEVAEAIRCYDKALAEKNAAAICDPIAKGCFLRLLEAVDGVLIAGETADDDISDVEVIGWPEFHEICHCLGNVWYYLKALESCLKPAIPELVDSLNTDCRTTLYRWWMYDARLFQPKRLVAWWYPSDEPERLARRLAYNDELLKDSTAWDVAYAEIRENPTSNAERLAWLVRQVDEQGPGCVWAIELVLRVEARNPAGFSDPPNDLPPEYETRDLFLDLGTFSWPCLGDWEERGCYPDDIELAAEFEICGDTLRTAIANVTAEIPCLSRPPSANAGSQRTATEKDDRNDTKDDTKKNSRKPNRHMDKRHCSCIAIYRRRRKAGEKVSMKQVVREYATEHVESFSGLYRTLIANSDQWKDDTKDDKKTTR